MQTWVANPSVSRLLVPAAEVARLVNAIASQDRVALASAVLQTVRTAVQARHCAVFAHEAQRNPRLLSGAGCDGPWIVFKSATVYMRGFFRHDPLQALIERHPALVEERQVLVCRERTGDIASAEYRQACYGQFAISDRLSIVMRKGRSSWLSVHIYRTDEDAAFAPADIDALLDLAPLISGCVARHYASDVDGETAYRDTVTDDVIDLGPNLTVREREVLMRILDGVTVNRIAEDLKLRPTTVATYRMRAYEKLGVGSRRELFATVLRQHASPRPSVPMDRALAPNGVTILRAA